MRKRAIVAAGLILLCSCAHRVLLDRQAPATLHLEPPRRERAFVTRAIDGDTIEVELLEVAPGGSTLPGGVYDVRLLGIDTPESVKPDSPVECFGRESSSAAAALLEGQTVTLVRDVEDEDQYGRLLRYVYIEEEMANARLVANGYALAYTYPPNVRHADLFVDLQREARVRNRGLWSPDTCGGGQ